MSSGDGTNQDVRASPAEMGCDPTPLAGGGRISEGNHGPFTHCSTADWGSGRGWNKSDDAATNILCKTGDRAGGGTSWTTPRPMSCAMTSKVRVVDGWWTEKAFRGRLGKSGWEGIGSQWGWEMRSDLGPVASLLDPPKPARLAKFGQKSRGSHLCWRCS